MTINKLEIAIEKDSDRNKAELHAMNLEVVAAFSILIQSLTKIVQSSPNKSSLKVRVSNGTVTAAIEGVGLTEIKNDYLQVINNTTSDKTIVQPWRDLQKLIKKNGVTYSSELVVDGQKIVFHQVLKDRPLLKIKKRVKPALKTKIRFFTGKLLQLGGTKTDNIHIEIDDQNTVIIECTEEQVIKANQFLKKTALISAWMLPGIDKSSYKFCSSYYHNDLHLFERFASFITDFENADNEIASLDKLHLECRYYLDGKDYRSFKLFLQLFNDHSISITILHSILMLTVPFYNHVDLKDVLLDLKSIFDKKLRKLNRKSDTIIEKSN
jgi:hypothetical protein